ncbi:MULTISPECIES: type II toxin-antitoxin system RelE/ParE family toxin [Dyadobacter]|uniref:Type II toxin-antitoxin system RelE/ParE family toxin n=1 Tax=Dyadobacter chenhuakuii TaxID=2909339 RepID=A0A9X1TSP1_9BACT|nr:MULTISPECIES: type II toxin-antitoxin system RelE/ParE family toxin [Dyadobacter]MCE7073583.1 type II toxin-antitoxin system RelE/ParE family toxin [Dyadobacter sp. CY327]MCF2499314.1 type II toxin-antitoxin system RelE/ParE family toxin [Dyadobacter chenhuakuii]
MSFKVKTIPKFESELKRLAKKYPSLKSEFFELIQSLKLNPTQGTSLGRSCFKIRLSIASKGKGKSGGGRVITYYQVSETTVFLIAIFDKSERESMPDKELKELLKEIL